MKFRSECGFPIKVSINHYDFYVLSFLDLIRVSFLFYFDSIRLPTDAMGQQYKRPWHSAELTAFFNVKVNYLKTGCWCILELHIGAIINIFGGVIILIITMIFTFIIIFATNNILATIIINNTNIITIIIIIIIATLYSLL